jgi:hypothetical protein
MFGYTLDSAAAWLQWREEVDMNRLMAVGLLAGGLLGGYVLRPPSVNAQAANFPFRPGDLVSIQYADTSRPCAIDQFYGSFVTCKQGRTSPGDLANNAVSRPFVLNLGTAISITLER